MRVTWQKALEASADPPRARQHLETFQQTSAAPLLKNASADQARILVALFSGSRALSDLLIAHPDWYAEVLDPSLLKNPRQLGGLRRETSSWLKPLLEARDYTAAASRLREFKLREMLRIAARDLARLGALPEIVLDISNVADICLDAIFQICWKQLTDRFGAPWHLDPDDRWQPTQFCVLGMGKLGGQELNYSSDVDVLFVYSDEGFVFKTPPRKSDAGKGMTNHRFFTRLAEAFISEVSRVTAQGMLFRIDLRLRPEGDAGPLTRSLGSYENYYAQWGQTWERMMLIKARCVAGDVELASEFLETVQPFRYPRSIAERIVNEIAAMKQRVESEVVKSGELERNVKLGRGGIREVEFVVQTLQLLNAGRTPFLQSPQTLPTLRKLVQYHLLPDDDAQELTEAYCFLRDIEHRLQMEDNLQTHTIPTERKARERLARLMGFDALRGFEQTLKSHTGNVRRVYERLLKSDQAESGADWPDIKSDAAWKKILAAHAFRDPDKACRLIQEFVNGPGYVHVSPRTIELARELLPRLLALCPQPGPHEAIPPALKRPPGRRDARPAVETARPPPADRDVLSDPDRVLARLDSFISAYGARATLYDLWTSNPSIFVLWLLLFDRSEFLAEIAIRTPDLVDELELSGHLRRAKTSGKTLRDLQHGRDDDDQYLWLRRYHEVELMRIGLRDILGLAGFEQNLVELSNLADACLQYALEVVLRKHKLKKAPLCIIGLGKLGGSEINYGSDLDIMFVADPRVKNLPRLQQLAIDVMDLLSAKTEHGQVFLTDARLRPDGEKGLLVNTLTAFEEYYRRRAALWEIQSLTRIRPIAGDMALGVQFTTMAAALTDFRKPPEPLAAYTSDWKQEIARMRQRIETERTPQGKGDLAIKTGSGGLVDAEFIAQTLCLAHGWQEANTLQALLRGVRSGVLEMRDGQRLLDNYHHLRRIEAILRRWSFAGETSLPDDPAPLYRVAVRCGFKDADDFMAAVKGYRTAIREVYTNFYAAE